MKKQLLLALVIGAISCNDDITGLGPPSNPATETFAASTGVVIASMTKMANGVYYRDSVVGTGKADTATTDSIVVTYVARLKDGTQVDAGSNVTFQPSGIIQGLSTGLVGMKEGGRRKLVIPSELGYGGRARKDPSTGAILIPRQSTLVFDVNLIKVHNDTTP